VVDEDLEEARVAAREEKGLRAQARRELEVCRRERNFMAESIRELQDMINQVKQ